MNEQYHSDEGLNRQASKIQRIGLIAGVIGLLASLAGLFLSGPRPFFQAYLFAYLFWFGLSLGSLGGSMLHYLVGGNWGLMIRRGLEAGAKTLWLMAPLFLPLLVGLPYLYVWTQAESVSENPLLAFKSLYLNVPFFILRAIVYFVIWIVLATWLTRWSSRQEVEIDPDQRRRFQRVSAIGLILYFLTMTFASVDWVMSLLPEWYSTIFGMLMIMEQLVAGMALAVLVLPLLANYPPLQAAVRPGHVRDLGAMLLTAVVLWAYLAFSQYLIIWSGNLPREVIWYLIRFEGGWLWVGLLAIFFQFILPFIILLPSQTKQSLRVLSGVGLSILLANLIHYFWQIKPAFSPSVLAIHWLDIALPVAMGGLWIAAYTWLLKRTPQVFLPEPRAETRMGGAAKHEVKELTG